MFKWLQTVLFVIQIISSYSEIYGGEKVICDQTLGNDSQVLFAIDEHTRYLFLCNNTLAKLDKNALGRFSDLERLTVKANEKLDFPADGSSFVDGESLVRLHCERCGVTKIFAGSLQGMPKLEILNLTYNRIKEIEVNAFAANTALEIIDLKYNQLRSVPKQMVMNLRKLFELDLSGNSELAPDGHDAFLISEALKRLRCDKCGFTSLAEGTLSGLVNLRSISLQANQIITVWVGPRLHGGELAFQHPHLRHVCLDENPLQFDCSKFEPAQMKWFQCDNNSTFECLATTVGPTSTAEVTTEEGKTKESPDGVTIVSTKFANTRLVEITSVRSVYSTKQVIDVMLPKVRDHDTFTSGISAGFIGGYLTLIVIGQGVALFLLTAVWLKLKRYDSDEEIDQYSQCIINPNHIYAAIG